MLGPTSSLALVASAVRPRRTALRVAARGTGRTPAVAAPPLRVREGAHRYEDEGSERRSLGSVSLASGGWWSAALSTPGAGEVGGDDTVLVRLERHGPPSLAAERSGTVELMLPRAEVDAVVTLLAGVVGQARRDGVLPAAQGDAGAPTAPAPPR